MTQFGSQVQTAVHVRLASAAALATCTYSSASSVLPSNTDLGAKLVATSNGALTIDGVAAAVDDEVLIKDQVATLQNGVYRVRNIGGTSSTWSLERSKQARDSGQFDGMIVSTGNEGSANASVLLLYSGAPNPIIGTDAISYTEMSTNDLSGYAPLDSPALTGIPTGPTATSNTSTTQLATTEFVISQMGSVTIVPSTSGDGPTTGALSYQDNIFLFISSGTMATFTLTLGDGAYYGQIVEAAWNHIVTALTMAGTLSAAGLAQPTAIVANQNVRWIWNDPDWVRIQ